MILSVPYLDKKAPAGSVMSTVSFLLQKLLSGVLPMTIAWFTVRDHREGQVC